MPNRISLIVLAAWVMAAQEAPVLLRPVNKSVLAPGPIEVIARSEQVLVDGKPVTGTQPVPGVFIGKITLSEGRHVLRAGAESAEVFVTKDPASAPAGFKLFRPHPPAQVACTSCHVAKGARWAMKGGMVGEHCMGCHDAGKFPQTHTHTPQVLQDCQMCHLPHGSTEFFHMKFSKETACKQCHG